MKCYLISYLPGAVAGEGLGNFRREICDSRPSAESRKALYSQESPIRMAEVVEHEGDLATLTAKSVPALYNGLGDLFAQEALEKLRIEEETQAGVVKEGEQLPDRMPEAMLKGLKKLASFKPVKGFKNLDDGRKKLFATIVGGSTPLISSAATEPPAGSTKGSPVEEGTANMATKTAKKAKKAKAKKASIPRVAAPLTAKLGAANAPGENTTSGGYIR